MFTFKKDERLSSKILINELFSKGKRSFKHPFQIIIQPFSIKSKYPAQVLIAVPKKKIRRAVDRNLIKRRIREAYRLNKHILYNKLENDNHQLLVGLIYQSPLILDYKSIEKAIIAIFEDYRLPT